MVGTRGDCEGTDVAEATVDSVVTANVEVGESGDCTLDAMVVGGADATEIVCEEDADKYASLPDCVAEMVHVPTARNVTMPAVTEQMDVEPFAMEMVGAKNASLSTDTV